MIIGQDLMKKIGMIVNFKSKNLIWDNAIVPMGRAGDNCPNPTLRGAKKNQVMQRLAEPKVSREATESIVKILDNRYENANLEEISQ